MLLAVVAKSTAMNESATQMNGMLRRETINHRLDSAVQPRHMAMLYVRYGRSTGVFMTTPA